MRLLFLLFGQNAESSKEPGEPFLVTGQVFGDRQPRETARGGNGREDVFNLGDAHAPAARAVARELRVGDVGRVKVRRIKHVDVKVHGHMLKVPGKGATSSGTASGPAPELCTR